MRDGYGDLWLFAICKSNPIHVLEGIQFDDTYRYRDAADVACLLRLSASFLTHGRSGARPLPPFSERHRVEPHIVRVVLLVPRQPLDAADLHRAERRDFVHCFALHVVD